MIRIFNHEDIEVFVKAPCPEPKRRMIILEGFNRGCIYCGCMLHKEKHVVYDIDMKRAICRRCFDNRVRGSTL